jgi:hypothetical protein
VSEPILLLAPLAVLALVAVFGFVGCTKDFDSLTVGRDGEDGAPAPLPYADEVKSSNPIAYWRLSDPPGGDVAKDEIGAPPSGDHPGAYQGAVTETLGEKPGLNDSDIDATPARFDGASSVDVPHDPAVFEMTQFTVEALVHPDSVVSDCLIVGNMSSSGGWALTIVPPSPDDVDIDGYFAPVVSDGSGPVGLPPVAFDFAKLGTAWHVAMTFDGTDFILYWDGAKKAWGPWPAFGDWPYAPNTQAPLQIGVDFEGAIQEVAVYDAVLTAKQISDHYLANSSPGS